MTNKTDEVRRKQARCGCESLSFLMNQDVYHGTGSPRCVTQRMLWLSLTLAFGLALFLQFLVLMLAYLIEGLFCGWDPRKWPTKPTVGDVCYPWHNSISLSLTLPAVGVFWLLLPLAWLLAQHASRVFVGDQALHNVTYVAPTRLYSTQAKLSLTSRGTGSTDADEDAVDDERTPLVVRLGDGSGATSL